MPSYRDKTIYVIVRHYFDGENKQSLVRSYNTEIKAREEVAKLILVNRNSSIGIETVILADE